MSELRRDPVSGRWVVIAPERRRGLLKDHAFRPAQPAAVAGGDMCPFCEGQEALAGRELLSWRAPGSGHDGPGWQVRVVPNRIPALTVESDLGDAADPLLQTLGGLGADEVIIESPDHGASLATMTADDVARVLWAWRERIRDLRRDFRLRSFVVVKNVGTAAGAMLDHPHSQLLALPIVPQHLRDELDGARAHHEQTRHCVFCDIAEQELAADRRIVSSDPHTIAFAPFAARVPFETCVMPRLHRAAFDSESDGVLTSVAQRLGDLMRRLDNALLSPPYTLLLHTAPVGEEGSASYHWHVEVLPRLEPVTGRAFDGGVYINPVPPEEAAEALRLGGESAHNAVASPGR
jgi:UDPglucose--hexose-1-phosphate uridylyltransferase